MMHPSSLDLEAFAVGEPLPDHFAGHMRACAQCTEFVAGLQSLVAEGPSVEEANDAVARAVSRANCSANDVVLFPARAERAGINARSFVGKSLQRPEPAL